MNLQQRDTIPILLITTILFLNLIGHLVVHEPDQGISTEGIAAHWIRLAECESGFWDANREPIPGSARWDYGSPKRFTQPSSTFHGGLQFHGDTWSWVAPMVGLGHIRYAYQATPQEQVRVAERVQELQSWNAWPTCARMIGLID